MEQKIQEVLQEFEYEQHAQNILKELLESYPSFVEELEDFRGDIKRIEIGANNPNASKPMITSDLMKQKKVIVHFNE